MTFAEDVQQSIDTIAEQAGRRAAARLIIRCGNALAAAEINAAEIAERDACRERLMQRYRDGGTLPVMRDLADAVPEIMSVRISEPPPKITVTCNPRPEIDT